MTYKKIAWLGLVVVLAECNEDGNVVGLEDRPMERVHYPPDTSLTLGYAVDQKLRSIEGEFGRAVAPTTFPERER